MNRSRLLLIGVVALALGAFVSFGVYRNLQSRAGGNNAPGVDVVIATADISVGTKIEDKDVKVVRFPSGDAQMTPVITLLVSPDDAQKLTLASTQGRIQLALRNPVDTKQQDLPTVKSNSLYKNISAITPVVRERPKRKTVEMPPAPAF